MVQTAEHGDAHDLSAAAGRGRRYADESGGDRRSCEEAHRRRHRDHRARRHGRAHLGLHGEDAGQGDPRLRSGRLSRAQRLSSAWPPSRRGRAREIEGRRLCRTLAKDDMIVVGDVRSDVALLRAPLRLHGDSWLQMGEVRGTLVPGGVTCRAKARHCAASIARAVRDGIDLTGCPGRDWRRDMCELPVVFRTVVEKCDTDTPYAVAQGCVVGECRTRRYRRGLSISIEWIAIIPELTKTVRVPRLATSAAAGGSGALAAVVGRRFARRVAVEIP